MKCKILPNWNTKKSGACNRVGCRYKGQPGCVEGIKEPHNLEHHPS